MIKIKKSTKKVEKFMDKYPTGTKGVITKPKISADATRVDRTINPLEAKEARKDTLSKMTIKQLEDDARANLTDMNTSTGVSKRASEEYLELAERKDKKTYAKGSNGIKIKNKGDKAKLNK